MMQYGSIDKRILKLVCCLRCKYLQQWKKNNVFDETDTYRDQEHCWQIAIWSSKLNNTCSQTVTEDTLWLNTMKVKLSCMDSLSSKKKKKDPWVVLWRRRWAPFLPLQMSPTQTHTPDDSGGWHKYHWPSSGISLTRPCCCFFYSLQSKCPSHLCQAHQGI